MKASRILTLLALAALVLPLPGFSADFALNPARDFGAIRRIDPRDYSGLAVVREDGSGLSSSTAAAFRAALEVFSKAETSVLIPNNASFTLAGLGTKPFSALTDKPTTIAGYGITDAASTTALSDHASDTSTHGVSEVADAADIPANSDFTLAGLSEKSYNSLTDKPTFGTMAIATATDYVATDTFTGHTGNTSNPHSVTYSQLSDKPTFGTMASETAADYLKVADAKGFETLALDATGNATFSYSFDVATLTVGGVDVLGDVHSALTAILGE